MNTQPEALQIAVELDYAQPEDLLETDLVPRASDEMRRLHQANADLLEALEKITHYAEFQVEAFASGRPYLDMTLFPSLCEKSRAAIAKHSKDKP